VEGLEHPQDVLPLSDDPDVEDVISVKLVLLSHRFNFCGGPRKIFFVYAVMDYVNLLRWDLEVFNDLLPGKV